MSNARENIIETAKRLFLQKSYHEVTMQDIVIATGLSKGAFYHYFSSKEKVFEEVVDSFVGSMETTTNRSATDVTLWEFCEAYLAGISDKVKKYNDNTGDTTGVMRANQYTLIFDAMKLLPKFRESQKALQQQEMELWIAVVKKARSSGEVTTAMSDEAVAKLFIFQNYGIGVYYILRSDIKHLTKELEAQFKIIYASINSK